MNNFVSKEHARNKYAFIVKSRPRIESMSIGVLNQRISRVKILLSLGTLYLQNIFNFLCAVFHHYDYIEVIGFDQAKLILFSLKINHTPKLSLIKITSYFCSL